MEIKILGPGCSRCEEVHKRTIDVLAELNIAADVEKVTDLRKIMEYKIFVTPGLIINSKVKCSGKIPSKSDIKKWIAEELK
ncbi:redox-active disulfide protein 2 [candidate division WOR-3 bacterium RBG_13_43_14]|uniref:Redox-active disulfide protein 2 n=1 Tax=candidate division WOR-3 bacterium RBG_13_43_14 TaxID=1802590 RepID=A0A1F4UBC9_UNCW3|nr:MAG: redox-active disulfide protein 2 [candidate division WOR-3 bacterium RBG_13_43_14]